MENKVVIPGKVRKDKANPKKYIVEKEKESEADVEIEVTGEGDYQVEKLSVDGLPEKMPDGNPIRWFNNFIIKKGGQVIKEKYFVKIPDGGKSRLVIIDSRGEPYYYSGEIKNNIIELTDGDPGNGWSP
ncbi:MAG: hypothetical protein LDL51_02350 [Chloroflexi bacterium]|nr:hypothetical protein [Chloroflexota bacterium]